MTPEAEIAQRLMEAISAPADLQPEIQRAITATLTRFGAAREAEGRRAALLERDAAWAAAVKASGLMLSPDSDNEAWRPLRALLEEAGK